MVSIAKTPWAKAIVFLIIVAGIGVTQLVITKRKEVEM